jgi:hypothetical protein
MLGNEARQTMFDLASLDKLEREDGFYEFERNTYKWTLVRDVRHGFTHYLMDNPGAEAVAMNKKRTAEMIEDVVRGYSKVFREMKRERERGRSHSLD